MADTFPTRYDRRVALVRDSIVANSTLDPAAAKDLAVIVVHAIDHIPETVR